MNSLAQERLAQDPGWRDLLAAYVNADPEALSPKPSPKPKPVDDAPDVDLDGEDGDSDANETEESGAGWIARIDAIDAIPTEHMARLHGRLIAFGLLQFQLTSATTGVVYRVTPKGRTMLESAPVADDRAAAA